MEELAENFRLQKVNGSQLLELDDKKMKKTFNMNLSQRIKLRTQLKET